MRSIETPLISITLRVIALLVSRETRIEGITELAVRHNRAHQIGFLIPILLIVFALKVVSRTQAIKPCSLSDTSDTPVIISHLHSPRDTFGNAISRDKT